MTYLKKKNSIPLILLCILSSITVFAPVPDSASFRDVIIVFIPIILYCILQKKCLVKSLYIYILLSFEAILASAFSIYAEFERTVLTYFLFAGVTVLFASIKFSRFQLH